MRRRSCPSGSWSTRKSNAMIRTSLLVLLLARAAAAQSSWDVDALSKAPKAADCEKPAPSAMRAVLYEGPAWKGNPTRVFAWIGLPKTEGPGKVPGMVLVHGGGGTAFADWAKLWTDRGYAAIAMDLCGCRPLKVKNAWER